MDKQPLKQRQEQVEKLLNTFSKFTDYKHGAKNPYCSWLNDNPLLTPEAVVRFLYFWYPVSRHQPQILLRCTAAYPDWKDRKLMMQNYLEEDGMVKDGDEPHYDLLEKLINKLG